MAEEKIPPGAAAGTAKKPEPKPTNANTSSAGTDQSTVQRSFFSRVAKMFTRFMRYLRSWLPF